MADLMKSRAGMKEGLTKAYDNLNVLIAEDDYEAILSEREQLKKSYMYFREAHMDYHETLTQKADIQVSDAYLRDVQQVYAAQLNAAKSALRDMQHQTQIRQELNNEQSFKALGHLINLPPLELQKFSGEPEEFDSFITTFNAVIGNVISDPAAKLVRLKSQLTGVALESIKMCRTDSGEDGYARAIKTLHERFGSPYIVCNSIIERLKYGPDVRSPSDVRTFSDELCNAEVTLKKNNMYTELDTQNNIIKICLRLESCIRYEWRSRVMKNKQSTGAYLKFSDFVTFVREHADTVNDPLYGNDALADRPSRNVTKTSVSSLFSHGVQNPSSCRDSDTDSKSGSHSNIQCHLCSKNHKLYACYRFKNMPVDSRCAYVHTNNLCILCLSKDHTISKCRSSYVCRINNCGERHSSSIHVQDGQSQSLATCVLSCDNSNTYMPTVPVVIDGTLNTFALLDTGSSTTFCSRRLMDKLKLQGTRTSYKLQTLHGSNKQSSETVNFSISSRNGTTSLNMDNVLVVDEIPVGPYNIHGINGNKHLEDLTLSHATQIDVLIGQDNSAALIPLEVRHGPLDAPFATRTLLGWSLNGCSSVNGSVPDHFVSNLISATVLNESVSQLWEMKETQDLIPRGTLKMCTGSQQSVVVDDNPQPCIPCEKSAYFMLDNMYATFTILVITSLLMWFFLDCIALICILYLLSCHVIIPFILETCYASTGGVLLQMKHVSQSVT